VIRNYKKVNSDYINPTCDMANMGKKQRNYAPHMHSPNKSSRIIHVSICDHSLIIFFTSGSIKKQKERERKEKKRKERIS